MLGKNEFLNVPSEIQKPPSSLLRASDSLESVALKPSDPFAVLVTVMHLTTDYLLQQSFPFYGEIFTELITVTFF